MSDYWVRTEREMGVDEKWYGPYKDLERVERFINRLIKKGGFIVAELISGDAGQTGKRFMEYHRDRQGPPGTTGWYDFKPVEEIQIPPEATAKEPI